MVSTDRTDPWPLMSQEHRHIFMTYAAAAVDNDFMFLSLIFTTGLFFCYSNAYHILVIAVPDFLFVWTPAIHLDKWNVMMWFDVVQADQLTEEQIAGELLIVWPSVIIIISTIWIMIWLPLIIMMLLMIMNMNRSFKIVILNVVFEMFLWYAHHQQIVNWWREQNSKKPFPCLIRMGMGQLPQKNWGQSWEVWVRTRRKLSYRTW